ncbi:DMT family transporter [Albimonas sp. CAU 1670]|uniref:DMT family transporter n=1 Tax=Albimonas sp. CAU 1670 TaxID=3032599 RepID=UPI0023DAEA11|nr:DMT family transporter [Albimonas sp. CAU 1670]MDF2234624.1 DMT family transporter [Albimonas sp. CAU 1670]
MSSQAPVAARSAGDISPPPPGAWRGYLAVAAAVAIWASWIVITRVQVTAIPPSDVALLRFAVPALVLAPVWLKRGLVPKGQPLGSLAIMAVGWGGPFVMLISKGLETVPASLFGPMVPATLPLLVALFDRAVNGVPVRGARLLGLVLIAASIALIVGPAFARADAGFVTGLPYLVCAACGWTAFTLAYRSTTLTGLEATAYVSLYSTPFLIVVSLIYGSALPEATLGEWAFYLVFQGVLAGVISVAAFGYAVRALGVAKTSAWTSLVPMGAAIGGWATLGEHPGPLGWTAVCAACLGVATVNGAFEGLRRRRRA